MYAIRSYYGYDAIEERARFELGMIRQDEVFVQVPDRPLAPQRGSEAVQAGGR